MNIQVTDQQKYNNVKRVWNYSAILTEHDFIDGHIAIRYIEDGQDYTEAMFGVRSNTSLEIQFGFRFVQYKKGMDINIDNRKLFHQ